MSLSPKHWPIALAALLCPIGPVWAQAIPFDFVEVTAAAGIDFEYHRLSTHFMDYAGVAVADVDGDGWLDVYLGDNAGFPSRLYMNRQDGTFVDEAAARGVDDPAFVSATPLFIDYDNDGDLDLFVGSHAGSSTVQYAPDIFRLFRNAPTAAGPQFHDVTAGAGFQVDPATSEGTLYGWAAGVTSGDFDEDGFTDLFVAYWNRAPAAFGNDDLWRLWRNEANPALGNPAIPTWSPRLFIDVTAPSGLDTDLGLGEAHQPVFVDLNRDGRLDLHVAVDFGLDRLYINQQNGTFVNVATAIGLNGSPPDNRNEMGIAYGDPDFDGDQDIHLTNTKSLDRFYRNDSVGGMLSFVDIALATGLNNSGFGWGTVFFDADLDGDQDHAGVSGHLFPVSGNYNYHNRLHINEYPATIGGGANLLWSDASTLVPQFSKTDTVDGDSARSLAALDFDNDGDLDLLVGRTFGKTALYRNTLPAGRHWLEIDLVPQSKGTVGGARVSLGARGRPTQYREVYLGSSNMTQEPARVHFGIGTSIPAADWLAVRWPDGKLSVDTNVVVDRIFTMKQPVTDARGDMNLDGQITVADQLLLRLLVANPALFQALHPQLPGAITGDINGDTLLDATDLQLFSTLP